MPTWVRYCCCCSSYCVGTCCYYTCYLSYSYALIAGCVCVLLRANCWVLESIKFTCSLFAPCPQYLPPIIVCYVAAQYAKEISRKWTKKVGTLRKHEEAAVAAVAAAAATTTTKAAAHVGTASSRGKNASIALEATVTHAATIRPILDEAWAYLTEQDRFCIFKDPVSGYHCY